MDADPSAVEEARSAGADVIKGDAETLRLGRTFEVVFAGELIEHLSCISDFLETARLHLVDDGVLVLTTPNVFAISNFAYRFSSSVRLNTDHTCWYCAETLTAVLHRHGFDTEVVTMSGIVRQLV